MRLRTPTVLALLALCTGAAGAAISYPIPPAERAGWAIYQEVDGQWVRFREDVQWPDAAGAAVPLPEHYIWLRQVEQAGPPIDSRLQEVAYPCPRIVDAQANTLTTVCAGTIRPEAALLAAVDNVAQQRVQAALDLYGLKNPGDQWRAIALLLAERSGQTLSAGQSSWLDQIGAAGRAYVDAVAERQALIARWVREHPGAIPAIGPDAWPPLPTVPVAP